MRWFALLCWLACGIHHAVAQRVDLDFSGAIADSARIDANTRELHFAPIKDEGLPRWYFRVQATQPGKALTFAAPSSKTLPFQGYFSTDAGITWQHSSRATIDEKQEFTRYEITPAGSSLLFSSHLPFSHAMATQWMESLNRTHGIEALPFGPPELGLNVLRFCEGDRVEARRPLIWIQAGRQAGEGAASWTATAIGRWLAGPSSEAVWIRQNAEVLILPLMYASTESVASGDLEKSIHKTLLHMANEERMVIRLELHQSSAEATTVILSESSPASQASLTSFINNTQSAIETSTVWRSENQPSSEDLGARRYRIEIPWNTPEAVPANYEKLGAALGEALAATLQSLR